MTSVTLWPFFRLSKQAIIALIFVMLLAACGSDEEPAVPPTVAATPAAGGMVMPTAAATVASAPTAIPTAADVLLIGDTVQSLAETGLRLYTDATSDASVMNVYDQDASFTVLDPSGEYAIYPVEQAGHVWYRLRAPDGLVGWGMAEQLTAVN
ncbi:MAG: hypothetical protein R3E79_14385 [Caldilineaceae bacterium]